MDAAFPPQRYQTFSGYLKKKFGGPVRKICLDAGFSCPNRDGRLAQTGCIFCDPKGFTGRVLHTSATLQEQIAEQIASGRRHGIQRFMAYFQPYTNTYAPLPALRSIYNSIRPFAEIKALAIGTRPDCIDADRLSLIQEFSADYEVWIELGVQSIHDATLARLRRGHTAQDFYNAVALTRHHPELRICVHVILGLPGETPKAECETAQALARLNIEGIKIHPLHVVEGTELDRQYQAKSISLLTQEAYVARVGSFLEWLPPQTVIQRLTADCPAEFLIAPQWILNKNDVIQGIEAWLKRTDTWQGKRRVE